MDNNFDNQKPETNENVTPDTTYTDPNAGATYTYGSVPKAETDEPTERETASEAGSAPDNSAADDAGCQQPEYGKPNADGRQQSQGYSQNQAGYQNQADTGYRQPEQGYTQPNSGYQQDYTYNTNYNSGYSNNYQNPGTEGMDTTPLSMGEWLLTLLAAVIPCAGLILYCIWAFGKTGNIHRRNFCRASLILQAISIVITIVFVMFITFVGISGYSYYY